MLIAVEDVEISPEENITLVFLRYYDIMKKINEATLIELIRKNDILYKKKYRPRNFGDIREKRWIELGKELNTTASAVKKKWRLIRDRYTREKKLLNNPDSGADTHQIWKHFTALHFIEECRTHKDTNNIQETNREFVGIKLEQNPSNVCTELMAEDSLSSPSERSVESPVSSISAKKSSVPTKFSFDSRTKMKRENFMLKNLCNQLASFVTNAKSFTSVTPTKAFFNSMAMFVEESNLPQSSLSRLRERVLKIVHEQIELG